MKTLKLFTLIKYSLNGQMNYSVHLTCEVKIKLYNLLRDNRTTDIGIVGLFDSLGEAQTKQTELRAA